MSDMYSAERSRLAPGTRLNGIFEIDQRIASGGMGEIYRGHAIETGDPVAIKVMRTDLADNAMALALFRKEASALHNIHHEAIVRYYIFSNDPGTGRHYLAMEFVDGQPLSELLRRGPLGFEAVRVLQERLAAGLNACHQLGIVHRDLSPDNVLIPAGDLAKAKIIDFGIARSTRAGDGTIIGSGFAGKYNYVSPEQLGLFGGDVTAKSDIYSLALVLAECLTGRPIDMGGTQFEVIEKRRVVPDLGAVDRRFRPLIEKMLQPNPADRPQSMADVAAWRPGAEAQPAPRRAALARDRSQAARPAAGAKPKPMLGGRLTKIALVLALLLGGGSVGLYFGKDLISPPINPPPPPPPLGSTESGSVEAPPRPPTDQRTDLKTRITEFLESYDGGDCFYVEPATVADLDLEGLGTSPSPSQAPAAFELLDREFERRFGFEARIGVHWVTPEQCPAVNFLSRTRKQPDAAPRLDIDASGLRGAGPRTALTGSVSAIGDRHIELLLIADDGYVFNVTEYIKPTGNTFSFNPVKNDPGPPRPQLLFAIASSRPLQVLKLPPDGSRADQVFAQVLAEMLRSGQTLNVGWKHFMLAK
jgi:eukaryotic-like serine/threonine-protein kinase